MAIKTKKVSPESTHPVNLTNIDHLEYNTQRGMLLIAEYGRNVQKMVEIALAIEDREKRNAAAQNIVNVMALLNPSVREVADYKHKLWDHLIIISDFRLDVDSPYPIPEKAAIKAPPKRLTYPKSEIRYKYYGKVMEGMIKHMTSLTDGPEKIQITQNLANFMKMSYLTWNKDTVDDSTIFKHLEELSKGQMKMDDSVKLNHTAEILAMNREKMMRENASRNKNRSNNNKNKRRKK
jgi:hypothetical protein